MSFSNIDVVRRAALPELMLVEDVALALRVTPATARRFLVRGDLGPIIRLGRGIAVLRESFLATLKDRQGLSADAPDGVGGDRRA